MYEVWANGDLFGFCNNGARRNLKADGLRMISETWYMYRSQGRDTSAPAMVIAAIKRAETLRPLFKEIVPTFWDPALGAKKYGVVSISHVARCHPGDATHGDAGTGR